jgi:hypothetical protein
LKRELDSFIVNQELNERSFKVNLRNLFNDLEEKTQPNKPYSRTYWFMFYKFEKIVLPYIEGEKSKTIIRDAFSAFISNNL